VVFLRLVFYFLAFGVSREVKNAGALMFQQIKTLCLKRLTILRRRYVIAFCLLVAPILMNILVGLISNNSLVSRIQDALSGNSISAGVK